MGIVWGASGIHFKELVTEIMLNAFFLILVLASACFAEGPRYRHLDKTTNLEFQNVYQDIRSISTGTAVTAGNLPSGSTNYIQNQSTLQSGAVANISSATVVNLRTSSITFPTNGQFQNNNGVIIASYTANGEITQPLQPSWFIYANAQMANQTGDDQQVTFPANAVLVEVYDQGGDVASSTFTAPVTGKYFMTCKTYPEGMTPGTHTYVAMRLITSNRNYYDQFENIATNNAEVPMGLSVVADMDANDTAYCIIAVGGSATTADISGSNTLLSTYFSGSLIN